jgi:hypothetical protein
VIYANILELYTEKIYGKIRMSCEDIVQTHKTKSQQSRCAREVYFGEVGGYAFSYSEKLEDQTIVLCKPFFESYRLLLEPLIQNLRDNKEYQKDPHQMNGKTGILLHEMTHLAAISETPASKRLQSPPTVIHVTLLTREQLRTSRSVKKPSDPSWCMDRDLYSKWVCTGWSLCEIAHS